jgi:hypothetical protein
MEVISFVDHMTALRFMASIAIHMWEFAYGLLAVRGSNE